MSCNLIKLNLKIGKEEIIVRDTKMMGISKELKLRKFNTGKIDCKFNRLIIKIRRGLRIGKGKYK